MLYKSMFILSITPRRRTTQKLEHTSFHTLSRHNDCIAMQVLGWTSQGHRGRQRPSNTWKRDLEQEIQRASCTTEDG